MERLLNELKVARLLDEYNVKSTYAMDNNNTKHYSDKANTLLFRLTDILDKDMNVVEPFAGSGSLLSIISKFNSCESYDIIPNSEGIEQRDTLNNPPSYKGKYVITNPPYLAKNKCDDKQIFDKYDTDDLYKAFIKSIIEGEVEGGAMIIPLNFLVDENTESLRKLFFSKYCIKNLNIFKCQMFDYTKYNTISFNFVKGKQEGNINTVIFNTLEDIHNINITLTESFGYRLFGEFYNSIPTPTKDFARFMTEDQKPSHIKIHCIDGISKDSLIRAEFCENPMIGKVSDRTSMTIVLPFDITIDEEKILVDRFNEFINNSRDRYYNLLFTNFRENNRKRISFKLAYSILYKVYKES